MEAVSPPTGTRVDCWRNFVKARTIGQVGRSTRDLAAEWAQKTPEERMAWSRAVLRRAGPKRRKAELLVPKKWTPWGLGKEDWIVDPNILGEVQRGSAKWQLESL